MNLLKYVNASPQFANGLTHSTLYNEKTFYKQFIKDLLIAQDEVIIESPYITTKRLKTLIHVFEKLKSRKIKIFIITRFPHEHDKNMALQSELGIRYFENSGIQVLLEDKGYHRKLAIIDRKIIYEGSLNILSQLHSREIMRKISDEQLALQMLHFLKLDILLKEN